MIWKRSWQCWPTRCGLPPGVEVVFECKGIAGQKLTADQHVHLFRIVQESISNALKHAEATRIEIRLLQANNAIELEICDNGKGFDTVCAKKGMDCKVC